MTLVQIVVEKFVKENELCEFEIRCEQYAYKPMWLKIETQNDDIDCEIIKSQVMGSPNFIGQSVKMFKEKKDISHWMVFGSCPKQGLTLFVKNYDNNICFLKFIIEGYYCASANIGLTNCPTPKS